MIEIPDTDAPSIMEERGWRFCLQEDYDPGEDKNEVKKNPTGFLCKRLHPTVHVSSSLISVSYFTTLLSTHC